MGITCNTGAPFTGRPVPSHPVEKAVPFRPSTRRRWARVGALAVKHLLHRRFDCLSSILKFGLIIAGVPWTYRRFAVFSGAKKSVPIAFF
jgi:hypothetical protein